MLLPLTEWMRRHHGVAHSSTLRARGYTSHAIARAVAAGHLTRVRRSWLVTADCAPERRQAAAVSGRVTCASAARLLGLWTHEATDVHIAVPPTSARLDAENTVLHWGLGPAPVARFDTVEPLLNVLFQSARCLPPEHATAIWESAVRKRLVDLSELHRVTWHSAAVDRVLHQVTEGSDSGAETRFVAIMRRCGIRVVQQVWIDGHPVDGLIGRSLVVQVDGFAFHRTAKDRRRDIAADARLVLRGYTVLRFDYQQVMHDPDYVRETVLRAMAQGLHQNACV